MQDVMRLMTVAIKTDVSERMASQASMQKLTLPDRRIRIVPHPPPGRVRTAKSGKSKVTSYKVRSAALTLARWKIMSKHTFR
jgi:hypothetical protein